MLRLLSSRVAWRQTFLSHDTVGSSVLRASWNLGQLQHVSGFSSGRQQQQQDGKPEQQREEQKNPQPDEQQGEQQQQQSKNPHLQMYLESLKQMRGSSRVQTQTLGEASRPWWMELTVNFFERWLQKWVADVIRVRVEEEFSMEDFLEGAKDAYYIVNRLLSEDDFETLRNGMLSAKLLDALEATKREYAEAGFGWRTDLEGDISAGIRGLSFWDKEQMRQYDEKRAEEAPGGSLPRPSGMWMVLSVQLKTKQRVTVTRQEDGVVTADLTDWRPQLWRFATGPLPAGLPVRQLETPWFLVSI